MLKIALTGGIATGKSYVLRAVPAARRAVPRRRRARARRDRGRNRSDGGDRRAVRRRRPRRRRLASIAASSAPIVFADPAARRELEAIVHPGGLSRDRGRAPRLRADGRRRLRHRRRSAAVRDRRREGFRQGDRHDLPAGDADRAADGARARARRQRASGWPRSGRRDEKAARADFVIDTDGTFEDTDRQVDRSSALES